jgi:hypothetical protein
MTPSVAACASSCHRHRRTSTSHDRHRKLHTPDTDTECCGMHVKLPQTRIHSKIYTDTTPQLCGTTLPGHQVLLHALAAAADTDKLQEPCRMLQQVRPTPCSISGNWLGSCACVHSLSTPNISPTMHHKPMLFPVICQLSTGQAPASLKAVQTCHQHSQACIKTHQQPHTLVLPNSQQHASLCWPAVTAGGGPTCTTAMASSCVTLLAQ